MKSLLYNTFQYIYCFLDIIEWFQRKTLEIPEKKVIIPKIRGLLFNSLRNAARETEYKQSVFITIILFFML